ncbi:MAG: hypothetical protein RL134_167 [Actinomycetota bacterium]
MATATVARPAAPARVPATDKASAEPTTGQKAVSALIIGSASALTVGVFAWAAWVTSQISIPV